MSLDKILYPLLSTGSSQETHTHAWKYVYCGVKILPIEPLAGDYESVHNHSIHKSLSHHLNPCVLYVTSECSGESGLRCLTMR